MTLLSLTEVILAWLTAPLSSRQPGEGQARQLEQVHRGEREHVLRTTDKESCYQVIAGSKSNTPEIITVAVEHFTCVHVSVCL